MPAASFDRFCDQGAPIRESALTGETALARDLASIELWERSIARSRHRRHLREVGRRTRRRRKGISLAMSAALAGGSVFPQAVGVASADSGSGNVGEASGSATGQAGTFRALLQAGNQGPLVAAVQQRLNNVLPFSHLAVDGVYGPLTGGAVAASSCATASALREHSMPGRGRLCSTRPCSCWEAPARGTAPPARACAAAVRSAGSMLRGRGGSGHMAARALPPGAPSRPPGLEAEG